MLVIKPIRQAPGICPDGVQPKLEPAPSDDYGYKEIQPRVHDYGPGFEHHRPPGWVYLSAGSGPVARNSPTLPFLGSARRSLPPSGGQLAVFPSPTDALIGLKVGCRFAARAPVRQGLHTFHTR